MNILLTRLTGNLIHKTTRKMKLSCTSNLKQVTRNLIVVVDVSITVDRLRIGASLLGRIVIVILVAINLTITLTVKLKDQRVTNRVLTKVCIHRLCTIKRRIHINRIRNRVRRVNAIGAALLARRNRLISLSGQVLLRRRIDDHWSNGPYWYVPPLGTLAKLQQALA